MQRANAEILAQKGRFIFQGTVQKRGAATMSGVPISEKTLIVRVDRILQAPPTLVDCLGQDITVQLRSRRANVAQGEAWIFYTNSWLFGDSIAVQAVGQLPAPVAQNGVADQQAAIEPTASLQEAIANRDLQECLATADTVICGRVTVVRLPQTTSPSMEAGKGDISPTHRPSSEHDPAWREAVIEVEEVEKGTINHDNVVVRFPSSDDVQWYRAPKFTVGQEGVFVLHHVDQDEREEVYEALHSTDYQPRQRLPVVRALLAKTN